MAALPKDDFNKLMDAAEEAYPLTLKVLRYITEQDSMVTTPMLIKAGVLTSKQINAVRAVMCLMHWGLLYPCGKTWRWWVSDDGRQRVSAHKRSL